MGLCQQPGEASGDVSGVRQDRCEEPLILAMEGTRVLGCLHVHTGAHIRACQVATPGCPLPALHGGWWLPSPNSP